MDRWVGKVALVTGASAGIGAGIAKALIREGLVVVGVAPRIDRIEKLGEKLKGAKGKLYARQCDVSKEEDILAVFEWMEKNLGGVDVLVNNAGVVELKPLSEGDTEGFRRILDINVLGVALCTREAIRSMKARKADGHIFNINSIWGHWIPDIETKSSLYPASKYAVTAMTELTRHELVKANTKIKITSISPGYVRTEILAVASSAAFAKESYETNPVLEPEDVANALVFVLATPPHVQICELTIRPVGENIR